MALMLCSTVIVLLINQSMKTNVTMTIDENLVRDAKILAARRGTSLSRLLAEKLEQLVRGDKAYKKAMKRAIKDMDNAPAFGFQNSPGGEELHER